MAIPAIASGIKAIVSLYILFYKDTSADFQSSIELDEANSLMDENSKEFFD